MLITQGAVFAEQLVNAGIFQSSFGGLPYDTYRLFLPNVIDGQIFVYTNSVLQSTNTGAPNNQVGALYNISADYCGEAATLEVLEYFYSIYVSNWESWSSHYFWGFDDVLTNYRADSFQSTFNPVATSAQDYIAARESQYDANQQWVPGNSCNMWTVEQEIENNENGIVGGFSAITSANITGTSMGAIANFLTNHMFPNGYYSTSPTQGFDWEVAPSYGTATPFFATIRNELENGEPLVIEIAINVDDSIFYGFSNSTHITVVDGYSGYADQSGSQDANVTLTIQDPWYNMQGGATNNSYRIPVARLLRVYQPTGNLMVYDRSGSSYSAGARAIRATSRASTAKNQAYRSTAAARNFKTVPIRKVDLPKKYFDLAPSVKNF